MTHLPVGRNVGRFIVRFRSQLIAPARKFRVNSSDRTALTGGNIWYLQVFSSVWRLFGRLDASGHWRTGEASVALLGSSSAYKTTTPVSQFATTACSRGAEPLDAQKGQARRTNRCSSLPQATWSHEHTLGGMRIDFAFFIDFL